LYVYLENAITIAENVVIQIYVNSTPMPNEIYYTPTFLPNPFIAGIGARRSRRVYQTVKQPLMSTPSDYFGIFLLLSFYYKYIVINDDDY